MSVVLLTLNEEANIETCLRSLARQSSTDFEIIIVDSASTDQTVAIIQRIKAAYPVRLRLHASKTHLNIGEARNLGVGLARAERVAFLSADLDVDARWVHEALRSLETHELVFGRQVHAPHKWNIGTAVRGLRYRFPTGQSPNPLRYASNVSAAYHKQVLQRFPFDSWADAAEDLLVARKAVDAGAHALYNAHMIVRHHDVSGARSEWRKNAREGNGWGLYARDLGLLPSVLAWGAAILAAIVVLAVAPQMSATAGLVSLAAVLWLPAMRRGLRWHAGMPLRHWFVGILASPAFDLAFLVHYVRALLRRRARAHTTKKE